MADNGSLLNSQQLTSLQGYVDELQNNFENIVKYYIPEFLEVLDNGIGKDFYANFTKGQKSINAMKNTIEQLKSLSDKYTNFFKSCYDFIRVMKAIDQK